MVHLDHEGGEWVNYVARGNRRHDIWFTPPLLSAGTRGTICIACEALSFGFAEWSLLASCRGIGFALGDSLFSIAKKVSKNACPCIR
ncbi:hypothetical protein NA640_08090, partial [Pseudomonas xanthomarina]|uniref:hypothetical protein n=1 Tax=Stutzerimonas xanthomarina TaxID=271420 RepID=UPI0020CD081B